MPVPGTPLGARHHAIEGICVGFLGTKLLQPEKPIETLDFAELVEQPSDLQSLIDIDIID
jgi:hypothetical protein